MKILTSTNWPITICSLLLLSFGILVIFSSSKELALQQLIYAFFGAVTYLFLSQFDYRLIKNFIKPFYIAIIILLIIVQIVGIETRGVIRWIPFGIFNIQPSEFAKPILILILSNFWSKRVPNFQNILKSLAWTLPLIILIFRQPDLGSSLTLTTIWMGILLAARVSFKKFLLIVLIFTLTVPFVLLSLADYQKQRLVSFLTPGSDPLGRGYNLIQSTIAVGSGQLFGRGLGQGTQSRLQFLPEFRTDFIFASIAEEMGFIGSSIIILTYLFLFIYCLRITDQAADLFGFLIVFGTISMLLFQTAVNIGMNIGLVPITGITLPLISYGGSSLISTMISLGMVASVARLRRKIDMESFER